MTPDSREARSREIVEELRTPELQSALGRLRNRAARHIDALEAEIARLKSEGVRAGVISAMEMLRDIQGVGTDKQAYDHVIRRLQDCYGGWDNQVSVGMLGAARLLMEDDDGA